RLAIVARQGVKGLCQSPTEYRMIAARAPIAEYDIPNLRGLLSAGESLNPEEIETFQFVLGLAIRDRHGRNEASQTTGMPAGQAVRPGSMGLPLPGFRLEVVDEQGRPAEEGELTLDPETVPTFFRGYLGGDPFTGEVWRTGDRVRRDADGFLWFE